MITRSISRGVFVGLIMAAAWGASSQSAAQTALSKSPDVVAFVDVSVIPMDRERVLRHQTVVVAEGRVTAVGPVAQTPVPDGALLVDGVDKFLIPGLADMHTHLAGFGMSNVERILYLLLANGVTTVRNVDYDARLSFFASGREVLNNAAWLRLKGRVAAGALWSPRLFTSGEWYTDSTKSIEANVAAYKAAGFDHLKIYHEDSVTTDSVAMAARRHGVTVIGHGNGGLTISAARGFKSIEHVPYFDNDSIMRWAIDTFARSGMWNVAGPMQLTGTRPSQWEAKFMADGWSRVTPGVIRDGTPSRLWAGTDPQGSANEVDPNVPRNLFHAMRNIKAMHEKGVGLLSGTDYPLMGGAFGVHRLLQVFVNAGLSPYEALATSTRNVAAYFGMLDSAGTVEAGKRADLILLTGNPLDDIRRTSDIAGVMVAGRWLPHSVAERHVARWYPRPVRPRYDPLLNVPRE